MNGEVYNVGLSNANLNKRELAEAIKLQFPDLVIIENEFSSDFDNRDYIVSNEKLEKTGWSPDYTITKGINELSEAYQMIITDNNKKYTNL
jgi:nucleoside-diphosphate-sugar epimerase